MGTRKTAGTRGETATAERMAAWPWLLAAGLLLLDQATKAAIRTWPVGAQREIAPGFLWLTHVQNTGASFGSLQGRNALLLFVGLGVLGALLHYHGTFRTEPERAAFALFLAGIVGNLIDRALFGSVTDMVDLGWFPVFNVADACLTIGVALLLVTELRRWRAERKAKRRN